MILNFIVLLVTCLSVFYFGIFVGYRMAKIGQKAETNEKALELAGLQDKLIDDLNDLDCARRTLISLAKEHNITMEFGDMYRLYEVNDSEK